VGLQYIPALTGTGTESSTVPGTGLNVKSSDTQIIGTMFYTIHGFSTIATQFYTYVGPTV
jgi:hypothetical protein